MIKNLKACPFCGEYDQQMVKGIVSCGVCYATGPRNREWNERAGEELIRDVVKQELKDFNQGCIKALKEISKFHNSMPKDYLSISPKIHKIATEALGALNG